MRLTYDLIPSMIFVFICAKGGLIEMRENSRNQLNAVASKGEVGLVRFEIRLLPVK